MVLKQLVMLAFGSKIFRHEQLGCQPIRRPKDVLQERSYC